MNYLKSKIREVPDFPQKGILFWDLTTAFKDPRALHIIGWTSRSSIATRV